MTELASVRETLAAIAELPDARADEAAVMARGALARLDKHVWDLRKSYPFLLACVTEDCITKCEPFGGGAMDVRARLGVVEVADIYIGDESSMSDQTIRRNAKESVLDSLRVEIVRRRVLEASDHDLLDALDALDAAERGGDDEVGEIKAAAHDRGLRLLS
ncbi:hypothetical protein [Aureimonas sp. N4]|uniref:hypothetical protein n=1 Tax=Aureimonas sp. N4 TaxID=1638165 RepID=UPI00078465E7|nr:hypothetical protein [Aureimonas sp. N4]